MLADNEFELQMCRLAIIDVAWRPDQGHKGLHASSMVRVFVSEARRWAIANRIARQQEAA